MNKAERTRLATKRIADCAMMFRPTIVDIDKEKFEEKRSAQQRSVSDDVGVYTKRARPQVAHVWP